MSVKLEKVPFPEEEVVVPVLLNDETMKQREEKILTIMKEKQLDCIVVYADVEHGSNFEYLTGFIPRFEEALLVYHINQEAYLLLGNEVLSLGQYSRLKAKSLHMSYFSLPDQPLSDVSLIEVLKEANIKEKMKIGVVGWKGFYKLDKNYLDVPHYIVEALHTFNPILVNATDIFISPKYGARIVNNANEVARYEYGQALAANGIKNALLSLEEGKSELEIASCLESQGQYHSVVTICSSGTRFEKANLYPMDKPIHKGERISLTVGYKGGLASRAAFAANSIDDLDRPLQGYEDAIAKPYFYTISKWLENIHVGMSGKQLFDLVESVLPQSKYHWTLNPGHLCADEEWLSSPIYKDSNLLLQSGMLFQVDIIPKVEGYPGCGCENGIVLADEKLRNEIAKQYPELYERIVKRKNYIKNTLGINIHEDVLPLSNMVAYYSPYLFNTDKAYIIQ